jgi:hypothetical protein
VYRWIRNTHLWLGLLSVLFVLTYGASSVQMAHNAWFSSRPAVSESAIRLEAEAAAGPRAAARLLMEQHGMPGELQQVRETAAGFSFRIARPGTVYEVAYARDTSIAQVRTSVAGFVGMLNRIHHVAGLWHDYPLLNVWGALVGLVSAALIVLSLSGIYLWFKLHEERLVGAILLACSLGYSLTLMVLLRAR